MRPRTAGPTPTALSIKAPTKVTSGGTARISGVLSSTDAACMNPQIWQVMRAPTELAGNDIRPELDLWP